MNNLPKALSKFAPEEVARTVGILTNVDGLYISSREHFRAVFDDGYNGRGIAGIDKVRAPIFKALWSLTDEEWQQATSIKIHGSDPENNWPREDEEDEGVPWDGKLTDEG